MRCFAASASACPDQLGILVQLQYTVVHCMQCTSSWIGQPCITSSPGCTRGSSCIDSHIRTWHGQQPVYCSLSKRV